MTNTGYNRIDHNRDDGETFYGYDFDDGTTLWVREDGTQDCITNTPKENDDYQWTVDENGDRIDD